MKHGYLKNGAVPVPNTFWVLVPLGTASGGSMKFSQGVNYKT